MSIKCLPGTHLGDFLFQAVRLDLPALFRGGKNMLSRPRFTYVTLGGDLQILKLLSEIGALLKSLGVINE